MMKATDEVPGAQATAADPASLAGLVARATALYEDVDFRAVQEWKAADPARKAIGFLPIYVPREVIHAAGALPVGIMGGGDRVEIVRGDSYFQSYICHLPRSVVEQAVSGRLDSMDGFLFPSICDVIRNLSGMFKVLMEGRYVHYFDLPQNYDAKLGGAFFRHELESVAAAIGEMTGIPVTDDALRSSVRTYNANRRAVAAMMGLRRDQPWKVPTTEYYVMLRAGYLMPVEEHTALVAAYTDAARASDRRQMDNIRVLVRGAFCEQPPLALLRTLERAGCYVVDDDFVLGAHLVRDPLPEDGDPWQALVDGYISGSVPTASKYDACGDRGERVVEAVRASGAEGVLLMAPSFCDPALLDQPMLVAALDRAGIPYTDFKYSEDTGQFQVIREQAGTFADAIKLWGSK